MQIFAWVISIFLPQGIAAPCVFLSIYRLCLLDNNAVRTLKRQVAVYLRGASPVAEEYASRTIRHVFLAFPRAFEYLYIAHPCVRGLNANIEQDYLRSY